MAKTSTRPALLTNCRETHCIIMLVISAFGTQGISIRRLTHWPLTINLAIISSVNNFSPIATERWRKHAVAAYCRCWAQRSRRRVERVASGSLKRTVRSDGKGARVTLSVANVVMEESLAARFPANCWISERI